MFAKALVIAPVDQNVGSIAYKKHVEDKEQGGSFQYNTDQSHANRCLGNISNYKVKSEMNIDFYYDNSMF